MDRRIESLAAGILKGERSSLARGITVVENEPDAALRLLRRLGNPGRSFVVGITGPPGTGKSTLVDKLIGIYREAGIKVGVIAVDPSSPVTGGALLGDRVRMVSHTGDSKVFIRSMASRGWTGGLSRATAQAVRLLDASGHDLVLLETVGIGQTDIEVVNVSHAVVVVLMPGLGDDVQVSKAGLMEVGDIYVVNKADLEKADQMVVSIMSLFRGTGRSPPVLKVSAISGAGIEGIHKAIDEIRKKFTEGDEALRLKSIGGMIVETARANATAQFTALSKSRVERLARRVLAGEMSIETAADQMPG